MSKKVHIYKKAKTQYTKRGDELGKSELKNNGIYSVSYYVGSREHWGIILLDGEGKVRASWNLKGKTNHWMKEHMDVPDNWHVFEATEMERQFMNAHEFCNMQHDRLVGANVALEQIKTTLDIMKREDERPLIRFARWIYRMLPLAVVLVIASCGKAEKPIETTPELHEELYEEVWPCEINEDDSIIFYETDEDY